MRSFVPEALLHQLDQVFGLTAEPSSDKRRACGQGQADRIDRLLDVSEWHTFRLHTFSARRRGLACGQTINLVVHCDVEQIDIPAHRVNKVIAADSESVTVTACDDYAEVVIRKLDAGRYRQRPAVKRMHAVSVNEPREVRRTSNTADGDNIVGLDLEFDKRLLERRQHTEIAATGAPVRINFPFKVREREFTGIGLHYCGHVSSSSSTAYSPPRRGGEARKRRGGQFGEILRRSDHPVCAASVASRHSLTAQPPPPLRGGECVLLNHSSLFTTGRFPHASNHNLVRRH